MASLPARDLEEMAQEEEFLHGISDDKDEAFCHAMNAAELYMMAVAQVSPSSEKSRLRRKFNRSIGIAEQLRAGGTWVACDSRSRQGVLGQSGENELLVRSSVLHGTEFPAWIADPNSSQFSLVSGEPEYVDHTDFRLSPNQLEVLEGWRRPRDLLKDGQVSLQVGHPLGDGDFMKPGEKSDLIQDLTTDCSVVASLCAAMRLLQSKDNSLLSTIFYPYDHERGLPAMSQSGKHILRMYFNGCFRRVIIDNRLPCSRTERSLHALDRSKPSLVWPALIEKAYLKVRGGYDFPGSNSGTDLYTITGWIPDQVFLQSEDLDSDELWNRVAGAFRAGKVIVTLGTGKIPPTEAQALGLIAEHDYAVLDLSVDFGARNMLIKNPWCEGPVWRRPSKPHSKDMSPGSFWMSFDDVVQNFESMFLNWDPALFSQRRHIHFGWVPPPKVLEPTLAFSRQIVVAPDFDGTLWILLSRHFVDGELELVRKRSHSLAATSQQLGFISIVAFESAGRRVDVAAGSVYRGPFVDSPQTLARLDVCRGRLYTVVPVMQDLPLPEYSFTLSLLSHLPLGIWDADDEGLSFVTRLGSWSRRTAGGSPSSPLYSQNPQFSISVSRNTPVCILLSAGGAGLAIRVDLVWAGGRRVSTLETKDLVARSGDYSRACALLKSRVDSGTYTVVCSTFEPGQIGRFALRVGTKCPCRIEEVPARAAGRLRTQLPPLTFQEDEEKKRIRIGAARLTRLSLELQNLRRPGTAPDGRPMASLRLTVLLGWFPRETVLAVSSSGQFRDPSKLVGTPEFDLEPGQTSGRGVWLLVEQAGTQKYPCSIDVQVLSDNAVTLGSWEDC